MRPVISTVTVAQSREDVFAFLDVMANHVAFTDHYLIDWTLSGPPRGVGGVARMRPNLPGPAAWLRLEVLSASEPELIVEESASDDGKRRNRGTYRLRETPGGGTTIQFTFQPLRRPLADTLVAPLTHRWMRRANDRAMIRLAERLAAE